MLRNLSNLSKLGKNETPLNIRLDNHSKDVKVPKAKLADKHFQKMTIDLTNTQDSQ